MYSQLKNRFKSLVFEGLHKKRLFPGQMTYRNDLLQLIEKLKPFDTDKKLIRIGPSKDGGYLVPDDLEGIKVLISPGVDVESKFEWECAEKGMEVHLIDASVKGPAMEHPKFQFYPKFLGIGTEELTLEAFIINNGIHLTEGDWMLQMDIEGAEWESLIQLPKDLMERFRIMVIEFHDLDNLFNRPFFSIAKKVFEKILQTHEVVHIHPNNIFHSHKINGIDVPRFMEFTFLRKDRIQTKKPATTFPHSLDRECTNNLAYPLPKIWYSN